MTYVTAAEVQFFDYNIKHWNVECFSRSVANHGQEYSELGALRRVYLRYNCNNLDNIVERETNIENLKTNLTIYF